MSLRRLIGREGPGHPESELACVDLLTEPIQLGAFAGIEGVKKAGHFGPLLDHIGDLRETVVTVDALHCQREHVAYLAERGAHWILTVKGNQPSLHAQLAGPPWRAVPDATRQDDRGHGRREIRALKILTISTGIGFPHAAQALQIRRRRRRLDQPKRFTTETVYAITDLRVHQAKPEHPAAWIRGPWHIENQLHWVRSPGDPRPAA